MDRRDFLKSLVVGGVAATTAVRAWPFRVFSFPTEIVVVNRFRGTFAELLAPGLKKLFIEHYLTTHSAWYLENPPKLVRYNQLYISEGTHD